MTDKFYLGRMFDQELNKVSEVPLMYDPDDLTTHGVVVGMTGSGKTGLCIALLEEAALQGLPAILIDPKGDLTNLLLHFPELAPQDFRPWLDPEMARRAGRSLDQAAEDAASAWRNGLSEWGIGRERLLALKNAAQFSILTPGSDAGIPVSVLASLAAPGLKWEEHREVLTERIASTVTAILGLVGFDELDPIRSREHILMANIFQTAWSQQKSLDLNELILQIQTPPFDKLGAFAIDAFFPPKERMALALRINNILAAPSFELWRTGQELDIEALLHGADGRPRHTVFYLAHLADAERMFVVTLLLSAIETWMRTQGGSTSLRALVYMDEIHGYLPPARNPPSKQSMLRMLKQGRAFGLGLLLATQNPVDVDYKALSNAGTWFIGKLQTEQDKQRLLDGLESAAPGAMERGRLDKLISGLGKRVFIMNNVHSRQPVVFQTRWAMNFLAGPMTRLQIPALNALVGAGLPKVLNVAEVAGAGMNDLPEGFEPIPGRALAEVGSMLEVARGAPGVSATRPAPAAGWGEYFMPLNQSFQKALVEAGMTLPEGSEAGGVIYRAALVAEAEVRFVDKKFNLDREVVKAVLVPKVGARGVPCWDDFVASLPAESEMDPAPHPAARFEALDQALSDAKMMTALQKDFGDWLYRTCKLTIRANHALGLYATPEISQAEFIRACAQAAREERDQAVAKATGAVDRQIQTQQSKMAREERELKMDETELEQRRGEEMATHAENIIGVFGRSRSNRRLSSSLTKRRLTEQAKEEVRESIESLEQYDQEMARLEETRQAAQEAAGGQWGEMVSQIVEVPVAPRKTDIRVPRFGVAWMPYYQVEVDGQVVEIAAYHA